jgi:hypothetical protein
MLNTDDRFGETQFIYITIRNPIILSAYNEILYTDETEITKRDVYP